MYNANYMDGVPVKIAEKYKPPPAIYKLPQSLANKLNLEENYYHNCPAFAYDLQLEQKALSKIEQWKRIRQRNKELRKERISKREQQRKREDEDRQKNLLYSVSYPSTDDLSSGEEDIDKIEVDVDLKEIGRAQFEAKEMLPPPQQICVTETVNSFHNILQPTVLSYNSSSTKSNSNGSTLTSVMKSTFDSKLSNSFNYKDFEDDTSSPFDNIELKTINDLDVLAQVLHNTQIKSPNPEIVSENATEDTSSNCNKDANNSFSETQLKTTENHLNVLATVENIPKPNNNLPKFNYDFNSVTSQSEDLSTQLRDHQYTISTNTSTMLYNANLPNSPVPQPMYNGLSNTNNDYYNYALNQNSNNHLLNTQPYNRLQSLTEEQLSKSKSVPDILKELRDEIRNSEIRRYRNCSYNTEESTQNIDQNLANETTTKLKTSEAAKEDVLNQLDANARQLVEQISAMGFPLKRVARIVQLVGVDDKKVIEHLIPLSELADLGFDECKISDALMRNENNKNKALDDLIS